MGSWCEINNNGFASTLPLNQSWSIIEQPGGFPISWKYLRWQISLQVSHKEGKGFGKRAAHPYPIFLGVHPPGQRYRKMKTANLGHFYAK